MSNQDVSNGIVIHNLKTITRSKFNFISSIFKEMQVDVKKKQCNSSEAKQSETDYHATLTPTLHQNKNNKTKEEMNLRLQYGMEMMSNKVLTATRKPIESQLTSFLLGITNKIDTEIEKSKKLTILPAIYHKKTEDDEEEKLKSHQPNYLEIISNIKDIQVNTNKRSFSLRNPQCQSSNSSALEKPQKSPYVISSTRKLLPSTISYDSHKIGNNRQVVSNSINLNSSMYLQIQKGNDIQKILMKGYINYDLESKIFWENNLKSMNEKGSDCQRQVPGISASSFVVFDCEKMKPIASKNYLTSIEIASLTKIMTCYLCLMICKKYDINLNTYVVRVSDRAIDISGTSAQLQAGDTLTILQLLHGLMLPSGNDASIVVAESMGKIIQRYKQKQTKKTYYETFIAHMNLFSKELKLEQSWGNSHGLCFNPNLSTLSAIITLAALAIRNPTFDKIINTKQFEIEIKNERFGLTRKAIWKNTNKLLNHGWNGVKTGTTESAGHCLMARKNNLLICVLNCITLSKRFSECVKLYEHFKQFELPPS